MPVAAAVVLEETWPSCEEKLLLIIVDFIVSHPERWDLGRDHKFLK